MLTVLTAVLLSAPSAEATEIGADGRGIGAGLVLGSPSGVTGKVYLDERRHAIDLALAARPFGTGQGGLGGYAQYLFSPGEVAAGSVVSVPWHIGVGANAYTLGFGDDDLFDQYDYTIGLRAPVGLDFDFREFPLQLFTDVALVMPVIPVAAVGFDIAAGARYYF